MLRRQSIVDGHDDAAGSVGETPTHTVVGVEVAQHEAPAVEVDEAGKRASAFRHVHAHGDLAGGAGNRAVDHLGNGLGLGFAEGAAPLHAGTHRFEGQGREIGHLGHRIEHGLHLGVDGHHVLLGGSAHDNGLVGSGILRPMTTTRPPVRGFGGAVAAGHYLAAQIGAQQLASGGNAADAAVAMGAALWVLEPTQNGPGGEVPILVRDPTEERPVAISGQGTAPAAASIERIRSLGLSPAPARRFALGRRPRGSRCVVSAPRALWHAKTLRRAGAGTRPRRARLPHVPLPQGAARPGRTALRARVAEQRGDLLSGPGRRRASKRTARWRAGSDASATPTAPRRDARRGSVRPARASTRAATPRRSRGSYGRRSSTLRVKPMPA